MKNRFELKRREYITLTHWALVLKSVPRILRKPGEVLALKIGSNVGNPFDGIRFVWRVTKHRKENSIYIFSFNFYQNT